MGVTCSERKDAPRIVAAAEPAAEERWFIRCPVLKLDVGYSCTPSSALLGPTGRGASRRGIGGCIALSGMADQRGPGSAPVPAEDAEEASASSLDGPAGAHPGYASAKLSEATASRSSSFGRSAAGSGLLNR